MERNEILNQVKREIEPQVLEGYFDQILINRVVDATLKAINYSQCCTQLPTKRYEIDFGGDLKCGIDITNNELNVVGAMNGWGNGVPKESIHITEL